MTNTTPDSTVDATVETRVAPDGRGFGLLTPARQRMFFRGIAHRSNRGLFDRDAMLERHATELQSLDHDLSVRSAETTAECRQHRKVVLQQWDSGDEQRIERYESSTVKTRDQRNRDLVVLRRERKKAVADEESSYDAAVEKVKETFKTEKPKVAAQQKRETAKLAELAAHAGQNIHAARDLSLRRLGGPAKLQRLLDSVNGNESSASQEALETPELKSLADCFQFFERLNEHGNALHQQMKDGFAVRFVESYYLVFPILFVIVAWCGSIVAMSPEPYWVWMLGCIPAAMVFAFMTHTACAFPVRKSTRLLHPQIEKTFHQAETHQQTSLRMSADKATRKLAELKRIRDTDLEDLRSNHERKMLEIKEHFRDRETSLETHFAEKLATIEKDFAESFALFTREMKVTSEQEAVVLAGRLSTAEEDAQRRRAALRAEHDRGLAHLQNRIHTGVMRAFKRAAATSDTITSQFPSWSEVVNSPDYQPSPFLRWLPLGQLTVDPSATENLDIPVKGAIPITIPLVLARETQSALLIDCPTAQMHVAAEWVRAILWRAMTAVVPGRVKLTMLDTVGRGQNFASLVALGDQDPSLIGHRAWSSTSQVNVRLSELTQYVEDILQTCLRDRFAMIEDFNREAGAMAEPYRILAAVGLPTGLSRDAIESLRALVDGGRRCGMFTIMVRDSSQPWPAELPSLPSAHVLHVKLDENGKAWHADPNLDSVSITPLQGPPASDVGGLAERIGRASLQENRVEIPLDELVPACDYDSQDSASGLAIPVGRQGVGRSLDLQLGSGMRQHMLVAGKTGSGKSTLLHAMIMSSVLRYSPDQLHLYLLDFKKGVEFKLYADAELPHARVIGIESEREFGRSVLQRLDEELQKRGELFRGAGVQEMAEYRRASGKELPRILLIVDEFQELFTRDDRVAQECTMLLDRLVRQGRSFGMHVVLSSQSLAGAYTLPRATLGQMAVRIALQCSEADAAMILADDNTAARLLSRPGEAIFNDAGGLVEGNQPFQVAWMGAEIQRERLADVAARHPDATTTYGPALVFEGNRPAVWTKALVESVMKTRAASDAAIGLLGEAVRIGPPTSLRVSDGGGRNVLVVADQPSVQSVLATWVSSAALDSRRATGQMPRIVVFEGRRAEEGSFSLHEWLTLAGIENQVVRPRESVEMIAELAADLVARADSTDAGLTLVVIDELERFRDLKQDESYGFSLDATPTANGGASLQKLLSEGPGRGFHTLIGCGGAESLSRWLPRTSHHDLELRIVGRVSANDSAQLIDTPEAANLATASMLSYDDANGSLEKFRLCEIPDPDKVKQLLG